VARLHTRIYLHFLGVLLVVGVVAAVISAVGTRDAVRRHMAEGVMRHLAALAGERMTDRVALATRAQEIHDQLGVDVAVRDRNGTVVAAAGDRLPPLGPRQHDDVQAGRMVFRRPPRPFAVAPVRDPASGEIVGSIAASGPRPPGMAPLWRPIVVVALALVVAAIATRPLAVRITRPLERLTDAARRLGGGDLSARASVPAQRPRHVDELAEVTRAFNDMADRVERLVRGEKELLANVSHELRSPLARIRVALALLAPGGENDRRLADVERDLAELEKLIEDVLTTARLDASGLPARLGTVDTRALLAELAERARHDPLTAGATVSVEDGPAIELLADEALLRRALWNLIENAAKYGAPPIVLAAARAGPRVEFIVRDAGAGVAPVDRERVFAPFYRADSARTPAPEGDLRRGVGLGLTLARRVAEVHGGTITIGADTAPDGREHGCRVVLTV
jgi:signal transduction histidine kinase